MTSDSALFKFLSKYQSDAGEYYDSDESDSRESSDSEETSDNEDTSMKQTAKKTPEENLDALKRILEKEPSLVNEQYRWNITPLHRVLQNSELSTISIVNLMLSYGAEVNSEEYGFTPLHIALLFNRGDDVIKALVEKGANVTAKALQGQSATCIAMEDTDSLDIVKFLIGAGCSIDLCSQHDGCALHCATALGISTNKEIIQFLIEMKVELNAIDKDGHSPLCYVLGNGVELWVIDMLVAAGGSLNACTRHASPLHCMTKVHNEYEMVPSLKADVIKKLLKLIKNDDPEQLLDPTPLQNALSYGSSEKEAIKCLFDHLLGSRTVTDVWGNSLLHLAASNSFIKPSVIEFLIESGVEVDMVNNMGETPLHLAVTNLNSQNVKILLRAGSSPNAMNRKGENPLQLFINWSFLPTTQHYIKKVDILKILFIAGSRIGNDAVRKCVRYVRFNESDENEMDFCKMLVKCYYLENPDFHIEHVIQHHPEHAALSAFGDSCEHELHIMRSFTFGDGRILQDLLVDYSLHEVVDYDFNQLEIIVNDAFPVYFDIIATKIIGTLTIDKILWKIHVYTPKNNYGQMVALNYYVVCNIADRLTDDNLLRFILAFRKVDRGICTSQVSN